jgi:hypothetical protein
VRASVEVSASAPKTIADLELALAQHPDEWAHFYKACDLYLQDRQYDRAVKAGERALRLRPDDPRSYYALAAAYRVLTQAQYAIPPHSDRIALATQSLEARGFDPQAALQALAALGLTVDQAGRRSKQLFDDMLRFDLKPSDRRFVREVCLKPLVRELRPSRPPSGPSPVRVWWRVGLLLLFGSTVAALLLQLHSGSFSGTWTAVSTEPTSAVVGIDQPPLNSQSASLADFPGPPQAVAYEASSGRGLIRDPVGFGPTDISTAALPAPRLQPSVPPPRPAPGDILLADDFEDPASGRLPKSSPSTPHATIGYAAGEYVVEQGDPERERRPAAWLPGLYANASLSIDARLVGDVDRRYLALGCRHQSTSDSHYRLVVVPDGGHFALARWDQNSEVLLTPWQTTSALRDGDQNNRLQLTCSGSTIAASLNGLQVALVQDSTYSEGWMWIGAGSSPNSQATVQARFDNLVLTQE